MASKREFDADGGYQAKRVKTENGAAENNPYLAHWNDAAPRSSKPAP